MIKFLFHHLCEIMILSKDLPWYKMQISSYDGEDQMKSWMLVIYPQPDTKEMFISIIIN